VIELTIYSRPGCHLCEELKATVQRAMRLSREPVRLQEIDISNDADLEARYGVDIPVLLVNGTKAAKHRVTEREVTRMLNARSDGSGGSG
jgi:glutaredoxin